MYALCSGVICLNRGSNKGDELGAVEVSGSVGEGSGEREDVVRLSVRSQSLSYEWNEAGVGGFSSCKGGLEARYGSAFSFPTVLNPPKLGVCQPGVSTKCISSKHMNSGESGG